MGLEKYHQKRDFAVTPEPAGDQPRASDPSHLGYLIQKHAARRLHYDFRLELDGVLLSWAVPKGPSLDPEQKRLAVRTEDHPIEYGTFEGTIPRGEYGGGTVMLWDRGTWHPEGDPREGLRKGRLTFRLEGERLKGSWRLIRTRGEDWLLVKRHDEVAGGEEAVERYQSSVVSGRSMEAIADEGDRSWTRGGEVPTADELLALAGAHRKAVRELAPELATLVDRPPQGKGWLHELKLDGYRVIVTVEDGDARVRTRRGLDWTERLRPIARAFEALPVRDAVYDGELVAFDPDGTTSFARLQQTIDSRPEALSVAVFDLPSALGVDLREVPLVERKAVLARVVGADRTGAVRYVDHVEDDGQRVLDAACRLGAEGIVSKRADATYRSTRTKDWLKTKCHGREDFVVGGYVSRAGSPLSSLLLGEPDEGELRFVGRVGTGFTDEDRRRIAARLDALARDDSPFGGKVDRSKGDRLHWVEPVLRAEVQYQNRTAAGILRHPSFQGLREDVADDVVAAPPAPPAEVAPLRSAPDVMPISNASKVLYPEIGLTKGELAAWMEEIGPAMLPYVANRPLTLVRCPNGHSAPCFFQKHRGQAPDAVLPVTVPDDDEPYLMVRDVEGLVGLVQLGSLEIHPWGSRADRLDRPDVVVLDLDPDEALPLEAVADAAVEVRDRLAALGLRSFLRSTGGKGLHVVFPIARRSTWDEVKEFTRGLAEAMVREDRGRYVAKATKSIRKGKIFVDWLRNSMGATAVASWSMRARPGAPVAVPLRWEELRDLDPGAYTVRTIRPPKRDPWEGFFEVRQPLPKIRFDELHTVRGASTRGAIRNDHGRAVEGVVPKAWSDKDERQYEHVLASERREGRSEKRAKEIAARTVNKERSKEGRTKEQRRRRSSRGGERTRDELYAEAKRLDIKGRSRMTKAQLAAAVRRAS